MSSDKKRAVASDLEYRYAEEDVGEKESLETPHKRTSMLESLKKGLKDRLPKKKRYRALLVIGIAVYILYKFLDVGTPPPKSSTPTAAKIEAQQLTKPPEETQKTVVAEKKLIKPVQAPVVVSPTPVKSVTITSFSEKNGETPAPEAQQTSAQIRELQASLDQISQSVAALESSFLSLTNSTISLSNKVNALGVSREKMKVASALEQPFFSVYYLHSMTEGRAWLSSPPKKDLTSVKVGDLLPGYGQIQKIDVRAGVVSTSSGRLINYGPNDG